MNMRRLSATGVGRGKITADVLPGTLVSKTIRFVQHQLPCWRDDPDRRAETSEDSLNSQLCKFLNIVARDAFAMVLFHHEEKQTGRRHVDISVLPHERMLTGGRLHTVYDAFLVMECKRLPAPSANRKKEYVTGLQDKSGGIQRFKLGLHGAELGTAAMIGYVQQGKPSGWHTAVNGWIVALAAGKLRDGCKWAQKDKLGPLTEDMKSRAAKCVSSHERTNATHSDPIVLHHLWIVM